MLLTCALKAANINADPTPLAPIYIPARTPPWQAIRSDRGDVGGFLHDFRRQHDGVHLGQAMPPVDHGHQQWRHGSARPFEPGDHDANIPAQRGRAANDRFGHWRRQYGGNDLHPRIGIDEGGAHHRRGVHHICHRRNLWTSPNFVQLFGPGIPRPGSVIQMETVATAGTTTIANSLTLTALTTSMAPTSAANLIHLRAVGPAFVSNSGSNQLTTQLYRGAAATALGSISLYFSSNSLGDTGTMTMEAWDAPSTTSSTTYSVYGICSLNNGCIFNSNGSVGQSAVRQRQRGDGVGRSPAFKAAKPGSWLINAVARRHIPCVLSQPPRRGMATDRGRSRGTYPTNSTTA